MIDKMPSEEILNFIISKDIYYYDDIYSRHYYRDPEIFSYLIPYNDKNSKNLIEMIKQYKIYNLYSKSTKEMQNKFYNIFLQKIGKFNDINYIFEIFPNDFIKNKNNIKNNDVI